MLDTILIAIILLNFFIIIGVVLRRFPDLANIKIKSIKGEKESRFKEKLIGMRLKRNIGESFKKVGFLGKPMLHGANEVNKTLQENLQSMKDRLKKPGHDASEETKKATVANLMEEAQQLLMSEEYQAAEKKLIHVLEIDSKNALAFERLGEIYLKNKDYDKARQSLEYALKIGAHDGDLYFDLTQVYKTLDKTDEAIEAIQRALIEDARNPRYLDTLLELSIIKKDKKLALNAFKKLQEANPENAKLNEWKKEIEQLTVASG